MPQENWVLDLNMGLTVRSDQHQPETVATTSGFVPRSALSSPIKQAAASRHPDRLHICSGPARPLSSCPHDSSFFFFFIRVMGTSFSSLFFAGRLGHNWTVKRNSNLEDFDHRGENFLAAKSKGTVPGTNNRES